MVVFNAYSFQSPIGTNKTNAVKALDDDAGDVSIPYRYKQNAMHFQLIC